MWKSRLVDLYSRILQTSLGYQPRLAPRRRTLSSIVTLNWSTGSSRATAVRGEAGIGKTRLVEEFSRIAANKEFSIHKGLVLDFGVGKGQDAIRSVVHSFLGVGLGAEEIARQAAAESAIAEGLLAAEQRPFLNDLLDLPQAIEEQAIYEAMSN